MELTEKTVKALARRMSVLSALSYMQALDDVSDTLGHKNWNTLRVLLQKASVAGDSGRNTIHIAPHDTHEATSLGDIFKVSSQPKTDGDSPDNLLKEFFSGNNIVDIYIYSTPNLHGCVTTTGSSSFKVDEKYIPVLQSIIDMIQATGKGAQLDCRIPVTNGYLRAYQPAPGEFYCRRIVSKESSLFELDNVKTVLIRMDVGEDTLLGDMGNPTAVYSSHNAHEFGTNKPVPQSGRVFVEKLREAIKLNGKPECAVIVDGFRIRASLQRDKVYECRLLKKVNDDTPEKRAIEFWRRHPNLSVIYMASDVQNDIVGGAADGATAYYTNVHKAIADGDNDGGTAYYMNAAKESSSARFFDSTSCFCEQDKDFLTEARHILRTHRKEFYQDMVARVTIYGKHFFVKQGTKQIELFRIQH